MTCGFTKGVHDCVRHGHTMEDQIKDSSRKLSCVRLIQTDANILV